MLRLLEAIFGFIRAMFYGTLLKKGVYDLR
jgi:hypothetical protein